MSWMRTLLPLSFALSAYATNYARADGNITWGSCETEIEADATLPVQCGNITVPLDYTDTESDATLDVQMLKVPTDKIPKKGNIIFNFGGPGLETRASLAQRAELLQTLTGGHYDLIANDPRGTANTLTFSCFENDTIRLSTLDQTRFEEFAGPADEMALGRQWAGASLVTQTCYEHAESKERGELIGTAFTARDIMQIVDAVEEDRLLRFWGLSYGTVLGSTLAAMFPERIDRIVIDGVMNPHQYYNSYDVEVWTDTDAAFAQFIKECIDAPEKCTLATHNSTATSLEKSIYHLLDTLKYHPIAYEGTIIDHGSIKTIIRTSLNTPASWPTLSAALDSLLSGNLTQFLAIQTSLNPPYASANMDEAVYGIHCADKKPGKHTFNEVLPAVSALSNQSTLMGQAGVPLAMLATQWKLEAKERYTGDFCAKTKHPMLVIGNTYDPTTPLRSARNISESFEGSIVLEHGGYGHCTLQHGSVCTGNAIQNYFNDGTLPKAGTVCEAAYPPFANMTWNDVLPKLGSNKTAN
ncbi:uncharacterized protein ASPGLDRAFT_66060 [Aspergillus glaucus CBS 516.65]|uniref:Uncharacterized protein n=1 Tax=Aspergillus glaucus CBS 516.65 TaxID=1160497 RepID=A0A1L9VN30_ASPGL|nr:hypothetical protein ASPGLDRAFT_66060 [Aspergillus glaucus CBS 516.65]OJJ85325.1 hypothetical protein ASPGLDRAFT_66060 [Aspergillus glaucus CBS 516.65]